MTDTKPVASRHERCMEIMSAELDILTGIAAIQAKVREAALSKSWADFDKLQESLSKSGDTLAMLETERLRLYPGKEETPSVSFYAFVQRFEGAERDALSGLYRQIKLLAAKIRYENEALAHYLGEAKTVVSLFLEAAFPDRRGNIYSRQGKPRSADMRSMVLDRAF